MQIQMWRENTKEGPRKRSCAWVNACRRLALLTYNLLRQSNLLRHTIFFVKAEALAAFKEYRNFNRIDLCAKGGWAQYLPGALGGGLPVPVLPRAPAAVDVSAGERVALPSASFFAPRPRTKRCRRRSRRCGCRASDVGSDLEWT
jgi:hypothetical protein